MLLCAFNSASQGFPSYLSSSSRDGKWALRFLTGGDRSAVLSVTPTVSNCLIVGIIAWVPATGPSWKDTCWGAWSSLQRPEWKTNLEELVFFISETSFLKEPFLSAVCFGVSAYSHTQKCASSIGSLNNQTFSWHFSMRHDSRLEIVCWPTFPSMLLQSYQRLCWMEQRDIGGFSSVFEVCWHEKEQFCHPFKVPTVSITLLGSLGTSA